MKQLIRVAVVAQQQQQQQRHFHFLSSDENVFKFVCASWSEKNNCVAVQEYAWQ